MKINKESAIKYILLHKREAAALVVLFILSILFRFIKIAQFTNFGHDVSRDLILTYKMYEYGEIIFRGPVFSVIWGYLSPLYYYILFPLHFLFNFHPLSSSILTNFVGVITAVIAGFISYRFFGKKTAFIAMVVFTSSVLLIENASSALNPSLMPPFALLFYYFLVKLLQGDSKSIIGLSVSVSFLLTFHPSGIFFLPLLVLLLIYKRPHIDIKYWIISAIIFGVIMVTPYLVQEKKMAWWTSKKIIEFIKNTDENNVGLMESIFIFGDAVLKNTSYFIFGKIIPNYIVLTLPFYLILLRDFIKSLINFRKIDSSDIVFPIILVLYLATFFILVPFEIGDVNRL